MIDTTHIIKAQEYEISLPNEEEAYALQSSISSLQESQINTVLNKVLNAYANTDAIYQFDIVELDLGTVSKSNYKNEIVYRIEEELTKFLSYTIQENGQLRTGKYINIQHKKIDAVAHFFQKGYFQWNTHNNTTPVKLVEELLQAQPKGLRAMLKRVGNSLQTRKRMIYQLPDKLLDTIVLFIGKKEGDYMITYKDKVIEQQKKKPIVKTSPYAFKNAVWEIILAYLFSESKSYYDKKSFLSYLIQKIAAKYNITYQKLIKTLAVAVAKDKKFTTQHIEFKSILVQLTHQHNTQSVQKPIDLTKEKEHRDQFFAQLTYYIQYGVFETTSNISSKRIFNIYFLQVLKMREGRILFYVDQWLQDQSKKERLLAVASKGVLEHILATTTNTVVKTSKTFIENLSKHAASFSESASAINTHIKQQRATFILSLTLLPTALERTIIRDLLRTIWLNTTTTPEAFIQFLQEGKKEFSSAHKHIIDQFIHTFDHHQETAVLEEIATQVYTYTRYTNSALWNSWLEDNLPIWMQKTNKSKKEIHAFIHTHSAARDTSIAFQQFIGNPKTFKARLSHSNQEIQEDHTQHSSKEIVISILTHGKLPWWLKQHYSWASFQADYTTLWKSSAGKALILNIIKKNNDRISYSKIIQEDKLYELWISLDTTAGKKHAMLLIEVAQCIGEQLLAIGSTTLFKYNHYKETVLNYFIKGSFAKHTTIVFNFLKEWSAGTNIYKEASVFELYISILEKHLQATTVYSSFKSWKAAIIKEQLPSAAIQDVTIPSLHAFLATHLDTQKQELPIWDQLQASIKKAPKQFDSLLQRVAGRASIQQSLKHDTIHKLIHLQLNTRQQKLYKETVQQLDTYQAYLTTQAYNKSIHIFQEILLLKLSTQKINKWGLSHWNYAVFRAINQAIGIQKNKRIIQAIHDKLTIENKKSHIENQHILAQLQKQVAIHKQKPSSQKQQASTTMFSNPILHILASSKDLTLKEIDARITKKLTTNQRAYYKQTIAYLDNYILPKLSIKETKNTTALFMQLVMLHLHKDNLRKWKLKDWGALLFYSTKEMLGHKKNETILKQIKERKNLYNQHQKLNLQLQQLRNKKVSNPAKKQVPEQAVTTHIEETIIQTIPSNQQLYYKQTLAYLQVYSYFISTQHTKAIKEIVISLLHSKIQANTIRNWQLKDWAKLLMDSIHQVIGVQKNQDILTAIKADKKADQEYINQLEKVVVGNPNHTITKTIVTSVYDTTAAALDLLETASTGDIHNLITQKITGNQLRFYTQTKHFIDAYASYLSIKDHKLLQELLSKYIAIQFQKNNLRLWKLEDWIKIIFYFSHQALGDKKYKESIIRFRESVKSNTTSSITTQLNFFNQLNKLATKEPQGILKHIQKNMDKEEEDYKKLGEEIPHEFIDPIFITQAGVIILAPYLAMLFQKCGLMEDSQFISTASRHKAVHLLSYAVTGHTDYAEHEMIMHKVLCGLPINTPLTGIETLDDAQKSIVDGLLNAVIQHWSALGNTSIEGLRTSFLQREGKLEEEGEYYFLKIEEKTYDMLLDQIPWNISRINLSWMHKILNVAWRG